MNRLFTLVVLLVALHSTFSTLLSNKGLESVSNVLPYDMEMAHRLEAPPPWDVVQPYEEWQKSALGEKGELIKPKKETDPVNKRANTFQKLEKSLKDIADAQSKISDYFQNGKNDFEVEKKILNDGKMLLEELYFLQEKTRGVRAIKVKRGFWFNLKTKLFSIGNWFNRLFTFTAFRKGASAKKKAQSAYRYLNRIKKFDNLSASRTDLTNVQKVIVRVLEHKSSMGTPKEEFDLLAIELARTEDLEKIKDQKLRELALEELLLFDQENHVSVPTSVKRAISELEDMKERITSREAFNKFVEELSPTWMKTGTRDVIKLVLARISTRAFLRFSKRLRKSGGEQQDGKLFLKKLSDARDLRNPQSSLTAEEKNLMYANTYNSELGEPKLDMFEKAYTIFELEKIAVTKRYLSEKDITDSVLKSSLSKKIKARSSEKENLEGLSESDKQLINSYAEDYDTMSDFLKKQNENTYALFQFDVVELLSDSLKRIYNSPQHKKFEVIAKKLRGDHIDSVEMTAALTLAQGPKSRSARIILKESKLRVPYKEIISAEERTANEFAERLAKPNQDLPEELQKSVMAILQGKKGAKQKTQVPKSDELERMLNEMTKEEGEEIKTIINRASPGSLVGIEIQGDDKVKLSTIISNVWKRSQLDPDPNMAEVEEIYAAKKAAELSFKAKIIGKLRYQNHSAVTTKEALEKVAEQVEETLAQVPRKENAVKREFFKVKGWDIKLTGGSQALLSELEKKKLVDLS
ncbi:hypothetical protein CROQUDRAFT_713786 [Cronartium quercuum f. sp. fusiforme G11]|uniref:Uncharacterized protein n=1 Tax=Cronartium quercuum f. sp. fusiforme G11 TaxID=708437 RepID=A0A9P6TGE4_9BASI|nr:hypothetical protein CROQUDRAFT_713786 [Cronartium quercuum f. sp. fusiforme G11]